MMPHRRFDERGWDEKRQYAPLGKLLSPIVEEVFMQRSIRYMWRVRPQADRAEWERAVEELMRAGSTCQFLLTREVLSDAFSVDEGFYCKGTSAKCAERFPGLLPSTRYAGYNQEGGKEYKSKKAGYKA